MMRNLKSKSQGGFAKNLMGTAVPYVFDEIQEFVERSYFNYCFNYIPERFGISDTVRSTSIDSVFGTETVISERDVESFLNHLRNSVVHPVRAVKSGENYILCDKHKGKTTFFAEIPTQKLMDYAGFVLNSCVNECERKEEIEKV